MGTVTQPQTEVVTEGIDWSKVDWPEDTGRMISLEYETEDFRRTDGD